ncbi:MAG TPA: hypothetical protein VFI47_05400 [Acidimicrobiales bacterium]|nr:hypothetical protein [Acidimicrobiales bacterium]
MRQIIGRSGPPGRAGDGGEALAGGTRIAPDGRLPLNTYGGRHSAGRMHGDWMPHEAGVQLGGEGGRF